MNSVQPKSGEFRSFAIQMPVIQDQRSASTLACTSSYYSTVSCKGAALHDLSPERNVLLMGETGAGKSTFINYLANYFLEGTLRSLKIVIPNQVHRVPTEVEYENHSETNLDDVTVSQTRNCTTYSFHSEGMLFRFIDTPGLSDTSNSTTHHVDDKSIQTILRAASEVGELHAIMLLINGSAARLTVNLRNTLQRIAGIYPDVLLHNMIVVFTNCLSSSKNFDESSLPITPKKIFVMNNSAFCTLSSQWNEEDWEQQELSWKQSMKKLREIAKLIDQLAPQSSTVFKEMLSIRNVLQSQILCATAEKLKQETLIGIVAQLKCEETTVQLNLSRAKAEANSLESLIQSLLSQESQLTIARVDLEKQRLPVLNRHELAEKCVQNALKKSRHQLAFEKRLQCEVPQTIKEIMNTNYVNIICQSCFKTCQQNCIVYYINATGENKFKHCYCMKGSDICRVCGCSHQQHSYQGYIIIEKHVWETNVSLYKQHEKEILTLESESRHHLAEAFTARMEMHGYEDQLRSISRYICQNTNLESKIVQQKQEAMSKKKVIEEVIMAADLQKSVIQSQIIEKDSELWESQKLFETARCTVKAKSSELKGICQKFNLAEELSATRESLRIGLSTLNTTEARDQAGAYIKSLDLLTADLTEELL